MINGDPLPNAVDTARDLLGRRRQHAETAAALDAAIRLAGKGLPEPEVFETLGAGWVSEEALAIAVCCALSAPDLPAALLAAVNHSG